MTDAEIQALFERLSMGELIDLASRIERYLDQKHPAWRYGVPAGSPPSRFVNGAWTEVGSPPT